MVPEHPAPSLLLSFPLAFPQLQKALARSHSVYLHRLHLTEEEDDQHFAEMTKTVEKLKEYPSGRQRRQIIEEVEDQYAGKKMQSLERQMVIQDQYFGEKDKVVKQFQRGFGAYREEYGVLGKEERKDRISPFEIENEWNRTLKQSIQVTAARQSSLESNPLKHKQLDLCLGPQTTCKVCYQRPPEMLNQSCRHLLLCEPCFNSLFPPSSQCQLQCIFCRQPGTYRNIHCQYFNVNDQRYI